MLGFFKTTTELPESLVQARTRYATSVQVLADLREKEHGLRQELGELNVKHDGLTEKIKALPGQRQVLDADRMRLLEENELIERELAVLEKRADSQQREHDRMRTVVWEEVLSVLLEQAPPGLLEWLSKTCTAAHHVKRCDALGTVLHRIQWTPPVNRDRGSAEGREFAHYSEELRKEFSLPHE